MLHVSNIKVKVLYGFLAVSSFYKSIYLYFLDQYYRSCNGRCDVSKTKTVEIQILRAVGHIGTLYTLFLSMEYIFL